MAKTPEKVIKIAIGEVGYIEKKSNKDLNYKKKNAGANNYTKYGEYFGINGLQAYWCDMFVDWCFMKAYGRENAKKLLCGDFSAYTPTSAKYYKKKSRWSNIPKKGDQIFFKNEKRINHTGLVYKVDEKYVYTIEGNTRSGNSVNANGGEVCKKVYLRSNVRIAGYGHPLYDFAVKIYTTVKKTSSKHAIKWLQSKLNQCCDAGAKLSVDGIWGEKTMKKLKNYWKQLGWKTNGTYAGKKTCNALNKLRKK